MGATADISETAYFLFVAPEGDVQLRLANIRKLRKLRNYGDKLRNYGDSLLNIQIFKLLVRQRFNLGI